MYHFKLNEKEENKIMPTRTARLLARGNGHTVEEEEEILQRRQRDINLHGFWYAFKRDSVMTFEKYEDQKKNNRLRGEW